MKKSLRVKGTLKTENEKYILVSPFQIIDLDSELNSFIEKNIEIKIIHINTNKKLYTTKGLLINRKIVENNLFIGDVNLTNLLWYFTGMDIEIEIIEKDEDKDK